MGFGADAATDKAVPSAGVVHFLLQNAGRPAIPRYTGPFQGSPRHQAANKASGACAAGACSMRVVALRRPFPAPPIITSIPQCAGMLANRNPPYKYARYGMRRRARWNFPQGLQQI